MTRLTVEEYAAALRRQVGYDRLSSRAAYRLLQPESSWHGSIWPATRPSCEPASKGA